MLTTKCGYDIDSPRPESQSERRQDWEPASVRAQLEASLRRLGTDYIDLYQLHNARLDPIHDDALWEELDRFRVEGKVRELGVALGPAIGWVEEGLDSVRERPIVSLQTVFNVLEQEPGLTFAAEPNVAEGRVGLISRVPHASDTLSGKITRDTEFPPGDHRAHRNRENMLDNFDKAETLAFLWGDTGRTIGQAAIAGILANPAFTTVLPTCVSIDDVREYAAASDLPLTDDEQAQLDERWARQLRRHEPLRDAAEVERRRVTIARRSAARTPRARRTTPPAPRCRVRRVRRARLLRHVDGRPRAGCRGHEARLLPALPVEARALRRGAGRRRGAAARSAHRSDQQRRDGASPGRAGLRRVLPLRRRRPSRVPSALRRLRPQRPRVRRRRRRRARPAQPQQ